MQYIYKITLGNINNFPLSFVLYHKDDFILIVHIQNTVLNFLETFSSDKIERIGLFLNSYFLLNSGFSG